MSLYGPKLRLPKIDLPSPQAPSWNLEKEKKLVLGTIILLVVVGVALIIGPSLIEGINGFLNNALNPSVKVEWKNNPLDLTKGIKEAELDLIIINTSKESKRILFNIKTDSEEVIIFCPDSIYSKGENNYVLENVAPNDKRVIPCIVRRNPSASVFTGTYTLEVFTSMGNTKTTLEVISK